jgi:hypothetical protein
VASDDRLVRCTAQRNEMNNIAKEAYALKMQIAELKEKHERLMERLKIMSNGETTVFGKYRLSFSIRPGVIEYSRIPQLKDVPLDFYRKEPVHVSKLEFLGEQTSLEAND